MLLATGNIALILLVLIAVAMLTTGGIWLRRLPGRMFRGVQSWWDERQIARERLKQARLQTEILEEQLRNEASRDLLSESRKPKGGDHGR